MSRLTSITERTSWNKGLKGYFKHTEKSKEKIRQSKLGNKNPAKRPEVAEKIRQAMLANPINYWKGKKRGKMFWLEKFNFSKNCEPWNKGKPYYQIRGKNHPNWKGGITKRSLTTIEYKQWRIAVFKRDNYICIICGTNGYLEADHIKRWADYPELRFDINNGRTLCKECHKLITFKKGIYAQTY